jgi:hypothetical protein
MTDHKIGWEEICYKTVQDVTPKCVYLYLEDGKLETINPKDKNVDPSSLRIGAKYKGKKISRIDSEDQECILFGRRYNKQELKAVYKHFFDYLDADSQKQAEEWKTKQQLCSSLQRLIPIVAHQVTHSIESCEVALAKLNMNSLIAVAEMFGVKVDFSQSKREICQILQRHVEKWLSRSSVKNAAKKVEQLSKSKNGAAKWLQSSQKYVARYKGLDPKVNSIWSYVSNAVEDLKRAAIGFKESGKQLGRGIVGVGANTGRAIKATAKLAASPALVLYKGGKAVGQGARKVGKAIQNQFKTYEESIPLPPSRGIASVTHHYRQETSSDKRYRNRELIAKANLIKSGLYKQGYRPTTHAKVPMLQKKKPSYSELYKSSEYRRRIGVKTKALHSPSSASQNRSKTKKAKH